MINVTIILDQFDNIKEVGVKGHSNFKEKGKDIVCAAISTLIQSAYLTIYTLYKSKNKDGFIKYKENDFSFIIENIPFDIERELKGITLFLITGLIEIEKRYKQYVKLDIKGVNYGTS